MSFVRCTIFEIVLARSPTVPLVSLPSVNSLIENSLTLAPPPLLNAGTKLVSPNCTHCVTVLFPSSSRDTQKAANLDPLCSCLERHGFAIVLLSCALKAALGSSGKIRIISTQSLGSELLVSCSQRLSLHREWVELAPVFTHFDTLAEMQHAVSQLPSTFNAPLCLHSLFIVGHADSTRLRVEIGGRLKLLELPEVIGLIHSSSARHVHLMVCKAKALARNLAKGSRSKGACLATIWISYGANDITTVPLEFGSPLSSVDWSTMALDAESGETEYTHMTAGLQAFLCYLSISGGYRLSQLLEHIQIPNHTTKRVLLYGVFVEPNCVLSHPIDDIYPCSSEIVPMLARIGTSVSKYQWWLKRLESTAISDYHFL